MAPDNAARFERLYHDNVRGVLAYALARTTTVPASTVPAGILSVPATTLAGATG